LTEAVAEQAAAVRDVCVAEGAREVREAEDAANRAQLWAGRKGSISAIGRISPNYYVLDGVVPRTKLPAVLSSVYAICERYGFPVANVFHAGDGNLHPNVLFDERKPGETVRVLEVGAEIMRLCVDAGGSITGEHGVGQEKRSFMEWIFSPNDIEAMAKVKAAFGSSDLYNPCKVFPTGKGCGEVSQAQVQRVMAQVGPDAYV
jgi:glycolate oxidase